jgi:hypothetical protein
VAAAAYAGSERCNEVCASQGTNCAKFAQFVGQFGGPPNSACCDGAASDRCARHQHDDTAMRADSESSDERTKLPSQRRASTPAAVERTVQLNTRGAERHELTSSGATATTQQLLRQRLNSRPEAAQRDARASSRNQM